MAIVWALGAIAFVGIGLLFGRHRHRGRYVDSAAYADEHWREQHERAKVHQHRLTEGR